MLTDSYCRFNMKREICPMLMQCLLFTMVLLWDIYTPSEISFMVCNKGVQLIYTMYQVHQVDVQQASV
jgi:hypothetical protein